LKLRTEVLEAAFRANVRTLANYLYVLRGCKSGRDVKDWKEAEKQLEGYLKTTDKERRSENNSSN
jgi:hypothetical protein